MILASGLRSGNVADALPRHEHSFWNKHRIVVSAIIGSAALVAIVAASMLFIPGAPLAYVGAVIAGATFVKLGTSFTVASIIWGALIAIAPPLIASITTKVGNLPIYVHEKGARTIGRGTTKTAKIATKTRVFESEQTVVVRAVFKEGPSRDSSNWITWAEFQHAKQLFCRGIRAITILRRNKVPGIYEHLMHRETTRKNGIDRKFESYDHYYERGTLTSALRDLKDPTLGLSKDEIFKIKRNITLMLLRALAKMHELGIYHRDIKPDNIFINENFDAVIGDFDFCCFDTDTEPRIAIGTPLYMPPEIYSQNKARRKSNLSDESLDKFDVWSMGLVLYNLYQGTPLNDLKLSPDLLISDIKIVFYMMNEPDKSSIDHLIWSMLRMNPNDRISAQEALTRFQSIAIP